MNPLIGVIPSRICNETTDSYQVRAVNIAAITQNGGTPLILPYTEDPAMAAGYLSLVSGLYFTGGCDIQPELFNETAIPTLGELCPSRDAFEILLYQQAASLDMPMLGICRGVQIMNVAAGGSLYQDLGAQMPNAMVHSPKGVSRALPSHTIQVDPGSRLYALMGYETLAVNSFHHEAVKATAPGYRATAWAPDQVIEGIESTELTFSLGVQWHPEDMLQSAPVFAALYKAFIAAAAEYSRKRIA
jgi:putative glutamine amidotransferase